MKYPRTFHLPWSEGVSDDDKVIHNLKCFFDKDIVITEKMDGENFSMDNIKTWARSLDSGDHVSRHYVKQIHGLIKHLIPNDMRICGENLHYGKSIFYDNLEDYILIFNIWNNDVCLSWKETVEWCQLLDLKTVPMLYEGKWDNNLIYNLHKSLDTNKTEGFVIRNMDSFKYSEFKDNVVKWVRKDHVCTDVHWMHQKLIPNIKRKNHERIC
jgi:ATP-dependent RNA circularization protein (DNA/RNA ligase family)